MSEARFDPRECIEVAELHDDAAIARNVEVAQAVEPGREIRRVVVGKCKLASGIGVKVRWCLPIGGVQRVRAIAGLLKPREILCQDALLVVEGDRAALQKSNVEPVGGKPIDARRRLALLTEQTH